MKMAISGLGFAYCRPHFHIRPPLFNCIPKVRLGAAVAAIETLLEPERIVKETTARGNRGAPEWKKLYAEDLGINTSMISRPTRKVLNGLKQRGYEVYLVGGCVRDLILKRTPKDFDIITTAELREVRRAFARCEIVGRRFPICHVHVEGTVVEVSSFSTSRQKIGRDFSCDVGSPFDCDEKDYLRWRNCLQRDFTINGLMYDPFEKIVYDYMGGLEDIRKAKVRTVIPANTSFQEDRARVLRAIRIAARLGFRFSKETAHSIKTFSRSILRLDKARLMMEMNYMLAYGSAEASLRILWKFGLLEILLPIQAAYFVHNGFKRRDKRTNMLLSLFLNMDKLLAPDRPCHSCLWVGLLAFHEALSEQPRNPLVVATFSLAVHNGGDITEAVDIARTITKQHEVSFQELSEPQDLHYEALVYKVKNLAGHINRVLHKMTDESYVAEAMSKYPQAPFSDLVFISLALYLKVCRIFDCIGKGVEGGFVPKQGRKIDYDLLAEGSLQEVRHTFARIVFDTVYPINVTPRRNE